MGGDEKADDVNRSEVSGRVEWNEEQKGKSGEGLSVQVRKVMGRAVIGRRNEDRRRCRWKSWGGG